MRLAPVLALLALAAMAMPAAAFGEPGKPAFRLDEVPAPSASEPTLGIPWDTDHVFFQSNTQTFRGVYDAKDVPTWSDVTPLYQVPINLDPMLWADPDTGRIHAGGLHGPCSIMMYSDDDGATWLPTVNMCSGVSFDHQTVGSGPAAGPIPGLPPIEGQDHIYYYCGQSGTIACARSLDGGTTFLPFMNMPEPCVGFHGHIRVSRVTGAVANPVPDCGNGHGFHLSKDGGLSWSAVVVPESDKWDGGFDSALQWTRGHGWLYYGMASENGVHVALSKDEGATWEKLGTAYGAGAKWFDVGALADPPVVAGTFTNVEAGDDDRAAISFLGIELTPGADKDFLTSNDIFQCDDRQEELVWKMFVAVTYDAGRSWATTKLSDDPVQVGGIWDGGGGPPCRNLLDFQDMQIDSKGRIHVGFGDGCIDECAEKAEPDTSGYRDDAPFVWRQVGGRGLFAKDDVQVTDVDTDEDGTPNDQDSDVDGDGTPNAEDPDADGDGVPNASDEDADADGIPDAEDPNTEIPAGTPTTTSGKKSPGPELAVLAVAIVALALVVRRRAL